MALDVDGLSTFPGFVSVDGELPVANFHARERSIASLAARSVVYWA